MGMSIIPNSKQSKGHSFVVASGHRLASLEALKVLKSGGNVVDAAVTGAAVLSVVLPYACGLGGDVYILFRDASTGKVHGLNGTGCAPSRTTEDTFGSNLPRRGINSATIPGMVRGWDDALSRFGNKKLGTLLQPAIEYANSGFAAHPAYISNTLANFDLLKINKYASKIFFPDGKAHRVGETVRQPSLANTLRRIANNGADEFYNGETTRLIVEDVKRQNGLLKLEDFKHHSSLWQNPISANFCGYDVVTMPPNSWGITLPLQLIELEAQNITNCDPSDPEFMIRGFRARQIAYKAVADYIGDPSLTEAGAMEILHQAVSGTTLRHERNKDMPEESRGSDTSNIVVADKFGNAVSLIQSISTPYGSGVVAGDTGVLMNNRMQGFTSNKESRNCIGPSKRPAHTLAPALILKNDEFYMSVGTPGAPGQTCTMAQFLTRVLGYGEDISNAVLAPRWSVNFKGEPIVENAISKKFLDNLNVANPRFYSEEVGWISFGSIKAAVLKQGKLSGVADGRRVADTLGY